jgi:hypothetical protein|tara:strand:+ start:4057 stop:4542 length:486 start_codon:yes stop_codon:yes gene_type:complete
MSYNEITAKKNKQKQYRVTVAFAKFDSHGDKNIGDTFTEPDVWNVDVYAQKTTQAIDYALHIITVAKAETMTDFYTGHPLWDKQETFSKKDIDFIRQDAEDRGIFRNWLEIEPTSIQAHLVEDGEKLFEMSMVNMEVIKQDENTKTASEMAEDILRNNEDE